MARVAIQPVPPDERVSERSLCLAYSAGGPPPPARRQVVESGVLAMAVFLGTEAMLFAALISAFLILRAGAPLWPPADQPRLPVAVTGMNTALLLLSAYTMQRAATASQQGRRGAEAVRWLTATALLGTSFLFVQGVEWVRLIGHGLRASSSQYAGTFYTLIGCHAVHVLAAVVTLGVLLGWIVRRRGIEQCQTQVAVCRLYWLFVVAVWPILYILVYLT
jgi:heme/copper-type cytochrome/quinol oxidase subunit 3